MKPEDRAVLVGALMMVMVAILADTQAVKALAMISMTAAYVCHLYDTATEDLDYVPAPIEAAFVFLMIVSVLSGLVATISAVAGY